LLLKLWESGNRSCDFQGRWPVFSPAFGPPIHSLFLLHSFLFPYRILVHLDTMRVVERKPKQRKTLPQPQTRDTYGAVVSAHGIEHFGMKAEVLKLYERLDKGIVSLDSCVKPGKINKFFWIWRDRIVFL
jgi:hypothetical protein